MSHACVTDGSLGQIAIVLHVCTTTERMDGTYLSCRMYVPALCYVNMLSNVIQFYTVSAWYATLASFIPRQHGMER